MKIISPILILTLLLCGFNVVVVDVCAAAAEHMVKVIYFVPRDRPFQWNIPTALDTQIKAVQRFYTEQMEAHGYGGKTFNLENDVNRNLVVHPVTGKFGDTHYHTDTLNKITEEIKSQLNTEKDIYIVVVDVSTERIQGNCGIAQFDGGPVMVPATGDCVQGDHGVDLIAHELGHALNLEHDFRDDSYIMSYGATRDKLSACAASMLNVNPFFNQDRTVGNVSNTPAIIQMLTPSTYPANEENWTLRFNVSDADGVYQVQFLLSVPGEATGLVSCKNFNNIQNTTAEFDMPTGATIAPTNNVYIRVVDQNGYVSEKNWILTSTKTTNTKTIDPDRTETYLTLRYDSPDGLVPTNGLEDWVNRHLPSGNRLIWEKTPDGLVPRRPNGFMDPERSIQFYDEWDYFFYSHAQSHIVYDLGGRNYTKFDAYFDMPNPCGSIASVEVIFLADGIEIYNSGVLRGAQTRNTKISFDIPAGTQTFTINVTDAGDGDGCDHFIFANARLLHGESFVPETIETEITDPETTKTYLTLAYNSTNALVPTNYATEWTGWKEGVWEKTPDGQYPPKPQGFVHTPYIDVWDHWIYAHAYSRIDYNLSGGNYTKFDAYFLMPNPCGSIASVEVICLVDGAEIYNSGVLRGTQAQNKKISFDIPTNTRMLTIRVTEADDGNGCDHFVFGNPRLLHGEPLVTEVNNYTDVNNDGFVNIIDLVLVAARYGEKIVGTPNPNPDVNRDGIVDIKDIILITQDMPPIGGTSAAPNAHPSVFTSTDWQKAYVVLPDAVVDRGIEVLGLLFGTGVPTKTLLLENYPNPFNPETWIPYELAKPANVVITIRAVDGQMIRKLEVGYRNAGRYVNCSHAAYWDGRNTLGEPVASGLYFYTLTTGDFIATRRMLIQK